MPGLLLEGVTHAYGSKRAVDDLTLAVGPGELVCLLGPSGCGKTTTLRIAAGFERMQAGRVLIDDRVVADARIAVPPEKRGVGLIFQDYALFPHLDALGNVGFGIAGGAAERRARAQALLERVGLGHRAGSYPHMLSGGEQQRVALARALAPNPGVMLMDEPFSGLDVRLRDRLRDETLALLREARTATLLVTHDPEEAMRMADRIALMRDGRIVQSGAPDELYHRPKDTFVARFFSEVNELPGMSDGSHVTTVLGGIPAGHPPGPVEVLVRPEDINVGCGGVPARVLNARSLGAFGLVHLRLDQTGLELRARVANDRLPAQGALCHLSLIPGRALVFPVPAPR